MNIYQKNKRYMVLAVFIVLVSIAGALVSDRLGPYIGYVSDTRYDEFIQKMLFNASVEYEKARASDPDSKVAHNNLGVILRIKGNLDRAEEEFKLALSKDENFFGARMNLGVVYAGKGMLDEAINAHLKALQKASSLLQPQIHYNLGSLYDERGEYSKAIEEYAIVKAHKDASIYLRAKAHVAAGVTYAKQGDYDLAYDEFKTALSLAPSGEPAIFAELNLKALSQEIKRYINSVSVSGSPAKVGGIIDVIVNGVPNANVSFSIENVISDIPMTEERQGIYTGRHVVSEAKDVDRASVIVKLVDKVSGKMRTDRSQSVTIDTVAKIDSVTISGNSERIGDVLIISVHGEPRSSVSFSIDGLVSSSRMSEQEEGKYFGYYTVKPGDFVKDAVLRVYLTDRAGNTATDNSKRVTVTSKECLLKFVSHAPSEIKKGDLFQVDIALTDCRDVFGFQMDISFDPRVLFVQVITEGDILKTGGTQTYWHSPNIDNDKGLITSIASVRQGTKEGVKIGGTLATITFIAKSPGISPLTFTKVDFTNPSAQRISGINYQNSSVTVKGIIGDVNNDSIVNANDLIIIIQNMGKKATERPDLDLNGDGIINILDVVIASKYVGLRQ